MDSLSSPKHILCLNGVTEMLNLMNREGQMRFSQIMRHLQRREIPSIRSASSLSYRLRGLERPGLIMRVVKDVPGKQTEILYQLTDEGREALSHLQIGRDNAKDQKPCGKAIYSLR